MSYQAPPPQQWPPSYPTQGDPHAAPRYPGGPTPPPPADKGLIWAIALVSGGAAFAVLVAITLSTDGPGSTSFRIGRMMPAAGGSAVAVAAIAQSINLRRWLLLLIPVAVFAASGTWYALMEVVPRLTDNARAEASGQADYVLETPPRAGDWTRLDGDAATKRKELAISQLEQAPDDMRRGMEDFVYAEYARGRARLSFFGFNAAGEFEDDLRDSSSDTLDEYMAGAGAEDPESVDAGDLGGSMACSGDGRGLPAGLIYCAWTDASTLGQVTIAQLNLDIEQAAEIAREIRGAVTSR